MLFILEAILALLQKQNVLQYISFLLFKFALKLAVCLFG